MFRQPFRQSRWFWCITILGLLGVGYIPARIALAQQQSPTPETILVLGGGPDRELYAASLAQFHPDLEVWVSSGTPKAAKIFEEAGIDQSRLHLDDRATDTVTNFTTIVEDFKRRGIQHVYVITSDFHRSRAIAIATLVFGSRGIAFTTVTVSSNRLPESKLHILRDAGRSILWLATGRTGASLKSHLKVHAFR